MATTQQEKSNHLLLGTQQEKPNHYTYLKEFRVEQCQSFLQHKCNQHRPFICFNWHFQNQRRRRPVRKREGTFNYSADNYCTKYDETTGICPDGDECPFLHRTAGDTERRYHLRYYKTCMCVHDTDSRGYCVKNGHHCAFAHGIQDQRPPVYDIKELESLQNAEIALDGTNAQNALDKERNLMNEDPKWQDTNYVLSNYKTEPCKRPPRLCRQGYACPQYHNSKDKRRSPRKFKYRSTPCPNVKHGEEWGEPGNCEAGDNCQYCHTRTEQQFHPEIYKSTKCNDVQQAGYCPRSVFCAFAHVEPHIYGGDEQLLDFDGMPTSNFALAELILNALPSDAKFKELNGNFSIPTLLAENSMAHKTATPAATVPRTLTAIENKAPGAQLVKPFSLNLNNSRTPVMTTTTTTATTTSIYDQISNHFRHEHLQFTLSNGDNFAAQLKANLKQTVNGIAATTTTTPVSVTTKTSVGAASTANRITLQAHNINITNNNINGNSVDMLKFFGIDGVNNHTNTVLVSALESTANQGKFIKFSLPLERLSSSMDDARENALSASLANSSLMTRSSAPINIPNSTLNNSINDFNSGGFAVNIPSSSLTYSPTNHSSLFGVSDAFNYSGSNSNKLSNSLSAATQNDSSSLFFPSRMISPGFVDSLSISPSVRISDLNTIRDDINSSSVGNSLFDNSLNTKNAFSLQSLQNQNNSDLGRLTTELMTKNAQILKLSNRYDEITRKYNLAEIQRDKAKQEALEWKDRYDLAITQMNLSAELRNLSIQKLKQLQSKLRSDLEDVEKVLYLENAKKCMKCEENNRTVTLDPCNHFILCDTCACLVTECPYCQVPIVTTHT